LVAAKPKLKKADPASRIGCKGQSLPAAAGGPLPSRQVTCQNITMAQFADLLQFIGTPAYFRYPVLDGTGLDGTWDFTFNFSLISPAQVAGLRGASPGGPGAEAGASDPTPSHFLRLWKNNSDSSWNRRNAPIRFLSSITWKKNRPITRVC
jgi:uncharacterized protein (TIGR03435 family)